MDWSSRAQKTLQNPRFCLTKIPAGWGECHLNDTRILCWNGRERCEGWGYLGAWTEGERAILEALGQLLENKMWSFLQEISLREAEAWLRDRNSQAALPEDSYQELREFWGDIQQAIKEWASGGKVLRDFRFPSEKVFATLSLPEKIQQLKAFFSSERLSGFYRQGGRLEVLDVDGMTVYIALFCSTIPPGALLDWLQLTLAETFREPALNLVPEDFPSGDPLKKQFD